MMVLKTSYVSNSSPKQSLDPLSVNVNGVVCFRITAAIVASAAVTGNAAIDLTCEVESISVSDGIIFSLFENSNAPRSWLYNFTDCFLLALGKCSYHELLDELYGFMYHPPPCITLLSQPPSLGASS